MKLETKIRWIYILILAVALFITMLLFTRCTSSKTIQDYGTVNEENELIIKGSKIDFIELDYEEDEIEIHMLSGEEFEFDIGSSFDLKSKKPITTYKTYTSKPSKTTTYKPTVTSKPTIKSTTKSTSKSISTKK